MTIRSRTIRRGDPNEGSWPPDIGTREIGLYHFDKETGTLKAGPPPCKEVKHGQAPYFISDTMAPYKYPSNGEVVTSKSKLKLLDDVYGNFTTDKFVPGDSYNRRMSDKARREDIRRAMLKSVAQLNAGTAPLTEEQRAECKIRDETVAAALGRDVFNFCTGGKIKDERGRKYRR